MACSTRAILNAVDPAGPTPPPSPVPPFPVPPPFPLTPQDMAVGICPLCVCTTSPRNLRTPVVKVGQTVSAVKK